MTGKPGVAALCTRTEEDEVTLALSGGQLRLHNEAQDCFDLVSQPGRVLINGRGTWTVTGGTVAYSNATGTGAVDVGAEVTSLGPGSASGTFDRLVFAGHLQ